MDKYKNFEELKNGESLDNYSIEYKDRSSSVAVIAPHGGKIEFGTTEIAKGIAGTEYNYYSFVGKKSNNNRDLHIASTNFDEPIGVNLVKDAEKVIAIHGRVGTDESVEVGGLGREFREGIKEELEKAGFIIKNPQHNLKGESINNICNRGKTNSGVQIEISRGLRERLLASDEKFETFTLAIRKATQK